VLHVLAILCVKLVKADLGSKVLNVAPALQEHISAVKLAQRVQALVTLAPAVPFVKPVRQDMVCRVISVIPVLEELT